MLADLRTLLGLAALREPGFRRGLFVRVALVSIVEWLVLYFVMQGLERQRQGEDTKLGLLLFVAAVFSYSMGQRLAYAFAGKRFVTVARSMIEQIAQRLHRLPLIDFEALERGTLMTRLMGDGNRVANSGRPLINTVTGFARLLISLVFVSNQSSNAASIALFVAVLLVAISIGQLALMSEGFTDIARAEAGLFDHLRDQLRGAILLRMHSPRAQAIGRAYRALSGRVREVRIQIWSRIMEREYASGALVYGLLGVNVFLLPLVSPESGEAIRNVNLALLWMLFSVSNLVFVTPQLREAAKAAERLNGLHEQLREEALEPVPPPMTHGRFNDFKRIEVEGLTFHYPSTTGRPGFRAGPVSVGFGRGELVFVIGHNGSGKSTFLKMFTGLYGADGGHIRVDGEIVTPNDLADYRALFGTIFTDHTLFERVYGMAPDDEARAAALIEEMGIAKKTAVRGGRVTERDLSTGQKKRLAMALTRLRDRPIMVFDEWAADQDPGFRDYYYQHLLPALRDAGKLVVIVSHDDQHFGLADRTIHFTDGRAVERVIAK